MCVLINNRDRNYQQTPDLDYRENLSSNDCDYSEVGELSSSMFLPGNLNIIELNVRGLLSKTIQNN